MYYVTVTAALYYMKMYEYLIASCTNELPCLPAQRCLRDKRARRNVARNPVFYVAYIAVTQIAIEPVQCLSFFYQN